MSNAATARFCSAPLRYAPPRRYTSQSSGVTGSGNFSGCVALAEQLLGLGVGQGAQGAGSNGCPHTRCSIGSEYLPSLLPLSNSSSGSSGASSGFLIMATEAFHYTISVGQMS